MKQLQRKIGKRILQYNTEKNAKTHPTTLQVSRLKKRI